MIRAFFRLLSFIALAVATIAAILDVTRSIADSQLVITALGQDWFNYHPESLNLSQAIVQRYLLPQIWDPVIQTVLQCPTWGVFAILAILFGFLGRKRKLRWQDKYGA